MPGPDLKKTMTGLCTAVALALPGAGVHGQETSRPARRTLEAYEAFVECDDDVEDALVTFHRLVTLGSIRGYQVLLSPGRQAGCQMYPSCSRYAALAFKNRGGLEAMAASVDRLHRCGNDLRRYELVATLDGVRFIDPPPGCRRRETAVFLGDVPAAIAAPSSSPAGDAEPFASAPPTPEGEDALLRFAARLFERGYHAQASLEYTRFLEYFPHSSHAARARRAIAECEYRAGRLSSAVEMATGLIAGERGADRDRLRLLLAKASLRSDLPEAADNHIVELIARTDLDPQVEREAKLLRGAVSARRGRWIEAAERFTAAHDLDPARAAAALKVCEDARRFRPKKPALAGALAVVPGAGYLYAGHPRAGLSALVVNGLFFWAAAEAFDQENRGLGTALVLFSSGWYVGNIYGSVATVQRQNVQTRSDHIRRLELGLRIF